MTSGQVWFLMIFIVPFIPAALVFYIIKPVAGDAKVGGSLFLFKDLRLDLGGSIATYVVIVVMAVTAFFIINRSEAIAVTFRILPANSAGEILSYEDVNWTKVRVDTLQLGVQAKNGTKYYVGGFKEDPKKESIESSGALEFLHSDFGAAVSLELRGSSSVSLFDQKVPLSDNLAVKVVIADELLNDWTSLVDLQAERISKSSDENVSRKLFLFRNGTNTSLPNIRFGSWGLLGLKSMSMVTRRISQAAMSKFIASDFSEMRSQVKVDNQRLIDSATRIFMNASESGQVEWRAAQSQGAVPVVVRDGSASILFAPSPRASFDPPIMPGEGVAVQVVAVRDLEPILSGSDPITIGYDYGAIFATGMITAEGGIDLCGKNPEVVLDQPGGKRILGDDEVSNTSNTRVVMVKNVKKGSRLSIPVSFTSSGCP
ncbi:hypothetical protein [Mesorhizobium sp. 113-1-2]|uniref:hypothetical protein n=1 Tax=Mesorhizobium sp. 113-1-2 TaxID=2744515 RepID=UPI001926F16A|nr:hypothetical protein [Mesorhizobium sp. 113-1-2]